MYVGVNANLEAINTTFRKCSAKEKGGAIYAATSSKLSLHGCTVASCTSEFGGGGGHKPRGCTPSGGPRSLPGARAGPRAHGVPRGGRA